METKQPEKPEGQPVPPKVLSISDPFPSGQVYSPAIFDVGAEQFAQTVNEKDEGIVVIKRPNGKVFAIASHIGGVLNGVSIGRYDDGKPMVYADYFQGKRNRLFKAWNQDGTPLLFSQYRMGKLHEFTCLFDSAGLRMIIEFGFDKVKCIRLVSGESGEGEFESRQVAEGNATTRELFGEYNALDKRLTQMKLNSDGKYAKCMTIVNDA